jgi:cation diffusion facilitator family transporter
MSCSDDCNDEPEPSITLHKKALKLEYFTVGYNIAEGVASIIAGLLAGSIALIGFGFDSAIESLSGCVLIWRLTATGRVSEADEERIEAQAVKLVAVSLFILAAYVSYESLNKLIKAEASEPTIFGIVIAVLSLIIMPLLARAKRRAGIELGSTALVADSKQTYICAYLSVALLIGLSLNYLFGYWWADPACALFIVVIIVKEGLTTLKEGKACSC